MPKTITLQLSPKQAADPKTYTSIAAKLAGVSDTNIALVRVVKRSIDARRSAGDSSRGPKVNLTLEVYTDTEPRPTEPHFDYGDVMARTPIVIVGGGPAGLFTALRLIELNLRPIILERGKRVAERGRDIARINKNEGIDPDSNYAFGEGGAGTFSDGKLFTRSKKRGDYDRALQTLVHHGASPEILYEAHPHIGTDRLPRIMTAIRETIERCGGRIVFGARVTDLEIHDNKAIGVWFTETFPGQPPSASAPTLVEGAAVVLAAGHSARDIYEMLHRRGLALEAKPFAAGVRIEHPQTLIDRIQYHSPEGRGEWLPAASYQLVSQESGRGVWSFCMCPGGFIVPAMRGGDESVVNGMSPSLRNSPFANSGIVTEVRLTDFRHLASEIDPSTGKEFGPLAGLEFQRRLERLAKRAIMETKGAHSSPPVEGASLSERSEQASRKCRALLGDPSGPKGGVVSSPPVEGCPKGGVVYHPERAAGNEGSTLYRVAEAARATAPAQRVADFVSSRPSGTLPKTSYLPGITPSRLDEWLPDFISRSLRAGISTFGRRMRGFVTNEAVVVGVESRTSTPVRIPRDAQTLTHPQIANLYPSGEGAGYAGGIISSALDGEKIAQAIARAIK